MDRAEVGAIEGEVKERSAPTMHALLYLADKAPTISRKDVGCWRAYTRPTPAAEFQPFAAWFPMYAAVRLVTRNSGAHHTPACEVDS